MRPVDIVVAFLCFANVIYGFKPYQQNKREPEPDIIFPNGVEEIFKGDFQNLDKTSVNGPTAALTEFVPVTNVIRPNQIQFYSFAINTTAGGVGGFDDYFVFLSGNICAEPANVDDSLQVYYSFNSSLLNQVIDSTTQFTSFSSGYFQALIETETATTTTPILYIGIYSPNNNNQSITWNYQIAVSQQNLVYQWDTGSFATVIDTDDDSALIVTDNLAYPEGFDISSSNSSTAYNLYIYEYGMKDYFQNLNRSWCAIKNGPSLTNLNLTIETSFTFRNGTDNLQEQFYVTGLTKGTKYLGYLIYDFGSFNSSGYTNSGGAVYSQFEFDTLETEACEILFDLDFCDKVAYAVPQTSGNSSREELIFTYDNYTSDLYQNFTNALQQIACDTIENAIFSPIVSCQNCSSSYKDWLCSVTIPRCSSRNITGYQYREIGQSRNDLINNVIQPVLPYFEVLPCIESCQAMVRNCPADFNFMCPTHNDSILLSYYWSDPNSQYPTCNYMGGVMELQNSSSFLRVNWTFLFIINMALAFSLI